MYQKINWEEMREEDRLQDSEMDGSGLTFETDEHGGEYPDMMPQLIKVTDSAGRTCNYEPQRMHGKVVKSMSYEFGE